MGKKLSFLLIFSLTAAFSLCSSALEGLYKIPSPPLESQNILSGEKSKIWWTIEILLNTEGKYKVTEAEKFFEGVYSFSVQWTGCMEEDEEDFILYHEEWSLLDWNIKETASNLNGETTVLSASDFSTNPEFLLNYILKREDLLVFDFAVKGFMVPQHDSSSKFPLILPATSEYSDRILDKDYSPFIVKGTNRVVLDKDKIFKKSVKNSYAWRWKRHTSSEGGNLRAFLTHSHDAGVKIRIVRRSEPAAE